MREKDNFRGEKGTGFNSVVSRTEKDRPQTLTERNLYRLIRARWFLMERVESAESASVINACTQDCANFTLGAVFGENSSHGARQGLE